MNNFQKIFFIGDIVGKPGRAAIQTMLPALKDEHGWNIVIANGENAAGGSGITANIANELLKWGVDGITLGDHVWDQRSFPKEIDAFETMCRPANLPSSNPGRRYIIIEVGGFKLAAFTLLGRVFMKTKAATCPFECADALISEIKTTHKPDAILVEVHAEATGEKIALGWYLDGRAHITVGTHTHIPTADARILPRGTAYLTDAGMTGPYQSCLGRDIATVIACNKDGMPRKLEVATEDVRISGFEVTLENGAATQANLRTFYMPAENTAA